MSCSPDSWRLAHYRPRRSVPLGKRFDNWSPFPLSEPRLQGAAWAARFPLQASLLDEGHAATFCGEVIINGPWADRAVIDIGPAQVTQVRVMLATPGTELVSYWGHLMFQLVREDGPDVVISYRGHVDELSMSSLKGLTGGYAVSPFAFLLPKTLLEYTAVQQRELHSYAVVATARQRYQLLAKLVQDYWNYRTGYHFLFRNCTSGVDDALRLVFAERLVATPRAMRPARIVANLIRAGVLSPEPIRFDNLQASSRPADREQASHAQAKLALENARLAEARRHLGAGAPSELLLSEVIRDQYEGSRRVVEPGAPLPGEVQLDDPSPHDEARRWLATHVDSALAARQPALFASRLAHGS